ncbi:MAG: low-specificity L-threonine aldolase [Bacteroidota bacterium]
MKKWIDLRSDTVTRPGKEMLHAMMMAGVGDDVFGEDPTVNELEHHSSEMFGMEAALFCPSGTMTNQIAIKVHTRPGDELICDSSAHILNYEGGGIASNALVQSRVLQGDRGRLNAEQIEKAINPAFDWLARTSLVCLENTVNRGGGSCYDISEISKIATMCKKHQLAFHLDGARIFNAIVLKGDRMKEYGTYFDSISVCLSKGLGAPVGSLLLGSGDFIKEARRVRKRMGGGMRQAGFLAAAGLYALKNHISKLAEDHANAQELFLAINGKSWVKDIFPAETNIVLFELAAHLPGQIFNQKLRDEGILVSSFSGQSVRMVTHLDVSREEIRKVISVLQTFGD